jgi:6-phosphofructokinase 2
MSTIVTLTMNPALDVFLEVPRLEPEIKMRASRPIYRPGGGGINVSRAIRHLGGRSIALFPAGGATGDMIVTLLRRESIDVDFIPIAEPTREDVNVTERSSGHEYRFVVPGPQLGIDEWQRCLRAVQTFRPKPDYVIASGSLPPGVPVDFFGRLAAIAREIGFRLIVDSSGEPLRHAAMRGTFIVKPNVKELVAMTGIASLEPARIGAAAAQLVEQSGVEAVIVSMGASGAVFADRNEVRRIAAPAVPVLSHIGAGDSMVAGIVVALARGERLENAVRYGVAAGTAAVTTAGHHLCSAADTDRLYTEMTAAELAMA